MTQQTAQEPKTCLSDEGARTEFESRLRDAVEEARSKWALEEKEHIDRARAEERQLAHMTAQERAQHDFDERSRALNEREAKLLGRELRARARDALRERDLPQELAEVIDTASEEAMRESLDRCEQVFRAAVGRGIEERMRGSAPRASAHPAGAEVTDEEYYRARFGR